MALFLSGFFCYLLVIISEQALVKLSAHDLEGLKTKPGGAAKRAVQLAEQLRSSLAALLLARIFLVLVLTVGIINWLNFNHSFNLDFYTFSTAQGLPMWLSWSVLLILLALALSLVLWAIQKIDFLKSKSSRGTFLLQLLSRYIQCWKFLFAWFIRQRKKTETATEKGEQPHAEQESANQVASEKRELELLKSIVQFGDVTVKQVMQPRSKVVAVDFKTTFPDLLNLVCENEFSRMPVIDEDLDNVTGILYVKDLVPHLDKPDNFEWQTLIRTNVMLVPESKRGSELLREFKLEKMHMALVVDEYGGSSGLVTLEDILEEVIGDIRDEFDAESDIRFRKLDEYNYLFEGQALLNDVCRITGLPVHAFDSVKGNSDTLAGLALELRGDIPPAGAEISWEDYLLTVVAADSRRIEQLKLTLPRY